MRALPAFVLAAAGPVLFACADHQRTEPLSVGDAEPATSHVVEHRRYEIVHLGTLGGVFSRANGLDNQGVAAGFSYLPGDAAWRAVLWRDGTPLDLGTLGGSDASSTVPWAGVNNQGMVVGISEGEEPDPLGQRWSCEQGGFLPAGRNRVCHAFAWESGLMTRLPTLGGSNAFAAGVNDRGQVVGWAETAERDPTCVQDLRVLGFKAVLWEPKRNRVQALPPYPGHSASAATAINQRGQVVGISGDCDQAVGRYSARRAVLWENGQVIDLGNLGGDSWHTPMAINERGDVVGFSNDSRGAPGDFNGRAFLWTRRTGMRPLGTLPGNAFSQANGINARGQVVGVSFGGTAEQRAFLWDGKMVDLNSLAQNYDGVLLDARDINDRGEIAGWALDPASGTRVPYIARPVGVR